MKPKKESLQRAIAYLLEDRGITSREDPRFEDEIEGVKKDLAFWLNEPDDFFDVKNKMEKYVR